MQISPEKIKYFRKQNGWSQEVLAKAAGVSLRTIQRIENDTNAALETQLAIAGALDMPLAELCQSSPRTEIYWKWRSIMQSVLGLVVVVFAVGMLFMLGGDLGMFTDVWSALFLGLFTYACTVIAFGSHGLVKSITGLRLLFTSDLSASHYYKHLAFIYSKQLAFVYAGALIAVITGGVAILSHPDSWETTERFAASWAVCILVLLYAAIFAEGVLRPLIAKLNASELCSSKE